MIGNGVCDPFVEPPTIKLFQRGSDDPQGIVSLSVRMMHVAHLIAFALRDWAMLYARRMLSQRMRDSPCLPHRPSVRPELVGRYLGER